MLIIKAPKRVPPPCPHCGRTVTHRTARQRAVCRADEAAQVGRDGFTIDGHGDRLAVSFAPAF